MYDTFVTMYEKTNAIGLRAEQVARGAPSTLPESELTATMTPIEIATKEFDLKKIPMSVVRTMPSGETQAFKLWQD